MTKIIILLSTYNGAKYLKNQIDSLLSQSYDDFRIIARDDGSSDESLEILKSYNTIELIDSNSNLGSIQSFAILLDYALRETKADYFMFCDQDDVWHKDKISITLSKMHQMQQTFEEMPLLVHTDLEVVDERLHAISSSLMRFQYLNADKDTLRDLVMQNHITGCTMMLNRKLVKKSLPIPNEAIMHDWWIGLVASTFGKIGFIDQPTLGYRQHTHNAVGAKQFDLPFILKKISKKLELYPNTSQAKAFLEHYRDQLDNNEIEMLEAFSVLCEKTWREKRVILLRYRLLKQGFIRNIGLFLKI